jgi:hypothetical protein
MSPIFPLMNKHPDDVQAAAKRGHARGRIVTGMRKTIVGMDSCQATFEVTAGCCGENTAADLAC